MFVLVIDVIICLKVSFLFPDFSLERFMVSIGVKNNPALIYNCDETGLSNEYQPGRVVGRKGSRSTYAVTSGKKGQITLMACANASGIVLPPTLIFRGNKENKLITSTAPPYWHIFSLKKVG